MSSARLEKSRTTHANAVPGCPSLKALAQEPGIKCPYLTEGDLVQPPGRIDGSAARFIGEQNGTSASVAKKLRLGSRIKMSNSGCTSLTTAAGVGSGYTSEHGGVC